VAVKLRVSNLTGRPAVFRHDPAGGFTAITASLRDGWSWVPPFPRVPPACTALLGTTIAPGGRLDGWVLSALPENVPADGIVLSRSADDDVQVRIRLNEFASAEGRRRAMQRPVTAPRC
jgi:hypothetical protein